MKKMAFANNLKKIIKQRSLKLSKISEATGIPMSTLSEWTGGREPKASASLIKLCRYLDVTLDELVGSSGSSSSHDDSTQATVTLDGAQYRIYLQKIK